MHIEPLALRLLILSMYSSSVWLWGNWTLESDYDDDDGGAVRSCWLALYSFSISFREVERWYEGRAVKGWL